MVSKCGEGRTIGWTSEPTVSNYSAVDAQQKPGALRAVSPHRVEGTMTVNVVTSMMLGVNIKQH